MVFNPKILDASIRDVVSFLSNEQKADVLLYAMQQLPAGPGHRMLIENAAQSCLQIASAHPENAIQTHLLRAKARFAAGLRGAAHEDVQAVLQIDPHHEEARKLMPQANVLNRFEESSTKVQDHTRFSVEVWREIANYLPRRDLRSLLFVPNPLSTIAGQLLFRKLHLQFGTAAYMAQFVDDEEFQEIDDWHAWRNADLLTFIISDHAHAGAVRHLVISAPSSAEVSQLSAFNIGILSNAIAKLPNLRSIQCEMPGGAMAKVLETVEKTHPTLRSLYLKSTYGIPKHLPNLRQLVHFAYAGDISEHIQEFLNRHTQTLRFVSVETWTGHSTTPSPSLLSTANLTCVELDGFQLDAPSLSQILKQNPQIEVLRLRCNLVRDSPLSAVFKADSSRLPNLHEFVLEVPHTQAFEAELFPAVTQFLRNHHTISVLRLSVPIEYARHFGYNAASWGALPALHRLRSLSIPLPKDLSVALSGWLVPRSVTALELSNLPSISDEVAQIWPCLPPGLRYLFLSEEPTPASIQSLATLLPNLKVLGSPASYQEIYRTEGGIILKPWSDRMAKYYGEEWLKDLGCNDARMWDIENSSRW